MIKYDLDINVYNLIETDFLKCCFLTKGLVHFYCRKIFRNYDNIFHIIVQLKFQESHCESLHVGSFEITRTVPLILQQPKG